MEDFKRGELFLMVGCPGAGKSTFLKEMKENSTSDNIKIVSRDQIRFKMVKENEKYFSKEREVFETFIKEINQYLEAGYDVYADATHLNENSRRKIMSRIPKKFPINAIYIRVPLDVALKQNNLRKGTRAYVPEDAIRKMYFSLTEPEEREGFKSILIIDTISNTDNCYYHF